MTESQLEAIKNLAERYGSSLDHTDVLHDLDGTGICGLPSKWVLVTVHRMGTKPHGHDPVITGGVAPDGRIST